MIDLTISLDEDLLRRARHRAMEEGTTVEVLIRRYLESFTGVAETRRLAVEKLQALSESADGRRGGRSWTRDELHQRLEERSGRA